MNMKSTEVGDSNSQGGAEGEVSNTKVSNENSEHESRADANDSKKPEKKDNNDPLNGKPVQYDTYKRAIDELKSAKQKIAEFEQSKKKAEEEALIQQKNWEEFAKRKEKEAEEERQKREQIETTLTEGQKLNAFLETAKTTHGDIPQRYWGLIDTDSIVIDPNTGTPDSGSLSELVEKFSQNYPEVIQHGSGRKMPNQPPKRTDNSLTLEEWKNLPLKERKSRMKDVTDL